MPGGRARFVAREEGGRILLCVQVCEDNVGVCFGGNAEFARTSLEIRRLLQGSVGRVVIPDLGTVATGIE